MKMESQIVDVAIEEIIPNRFQPRLSFDDKALEELAESIKKHGIIQPLVLRRIENKYEIVAGERRYKAAIKAGLSTVPAVIATIDDNTSTEVALVENIQRKNLSAIEEAKSYKSILDLEAITQETLAQKLGISQSNIANKLRLLNLGDEVQKALADDKISERHARSLLKITDRQKQNELLKRIIEERLTVRQLDDEINKINNNTSMIDETPLVDIAPSVEQIKETAIDINPPKQVPDLSSMLKMNDTPETPAVQSTPKKEAPAGRFFNFLEEEETNMNMGETESSIIPTVSNSANIEITATPSPFEPTSLTPVIDETKINDQPSIEPVVSSPSIAPTQSFDVTPIVNENNAVQPIMPTTETLGSEAPQMINPLEILESPESEIMPITSLVEENSMPKNDNEVFAPIESPTQIVNPVASAFQPLNELIVKEEPVIETPVVEQPEPVETLIEPKSEVEILDMTPGTLNSTNITPVSATTPAFNEPDIKKLEDPISKIETLSPDYVPPKIETPNSYGLSNAIMEIRDKTIEVEKRGFVVNVEELDLEDSYKIVVTINK